MCDSRHKSPYHSRSTSRSEEHTSELQSQSNLVCRLLLEKKKKTKRYLSPKRTLYARAIRYPASLLTIRPQVPCDSSVSCVNPTSFGHRHESGASVSVGSS